jgi:CBS domain-containing protein
MKVSEVMTHGVYTTSPDDTVQTAAQTMADLDTGVIPIGENDRLIGILTDRDLTMRVVAEARDPTTTFVRDVMSQEVRCCLEDDSVEEAAVKMSQWQVHRLPVLSKEHRLEHPFSYPVPAGTSREEDIVFVIPSNLNLDRAVLRIHYYNERKEIPLASLPKHSRH